MRKLIVALMGMLLCTGAATAGPNLLVDARSGDVLHAHDATRPWHPASITKLMTAHVALAAVTSGRLSMNSQVVISSRAAETPPSSSGIPRGSAISLEEALRIMLVRSANDIAVAIAESVSGDVGSFVAEMNREARSLGMSGTRFANPSGLHDPNQVSTARDLAVLALAIGRRHTANADLFMTPFITLNGTRLPNTNEMMGQYPGIDGMKTGYICASGFNLVATATRNGRRLVSIVLGAPNKVARAGQTSTLLDAGFSGRSEKVSNLREMKTDAPGRVLDPPSCTKKPDAAFGSRRGGLNSKPVMSGRAPLAKTVPSNRF